MGDIPAHLEPTPLQRHYLKKYLLTKAIEDEIAQLNDATILRHLGAPFQQGAEEIDAYHTVLPVVRLVFKRFVTTFPFLQHTNQDILWRDKVLPFIVCFGEKRISSSEDREESSKREKLGLRLRSMLVLLMNAALHAGQEESSSAQAVDSTSPHTSTTNGTLDVNVAGVRTVLKSHKMRKRASHSEFIIRTKKIGQPDVIVARRYGAFRKLQEQLREEFPGKQITRLPGKDRAPATASSYIPSTSMFTRDSIDDDSGASADENELEHIVVPREKQRLTLRAFLRRVLKDPQLAESTALRHFLYDQPIKLNVAEESDCRLRITLDDQRKADELKFIEVANARARDLEAHMSGFKQQLVQENGLSRVFAAIRECETIEALPIQYKKVIEWARIELASTLYHLFLADDNSSELFTQAKRIHALFPYSVLKNIIRFSNPMTMMRAGIDLFLATPFGRSSLFQRMFATTLTEDITELEQSCQLLRTEIADPQICEKLKNFVYASEDEQFVIRMEAEEDDVDLVVALMRSSIQPLLTGSQITQIFMGNIAWTAAIEGSEYKQADARLYSAYKQLLKYLTRQRDKQQMMELLFEGVTSNLLKDIVTIFYEPLARVYKAANIHNSVSDFGHFMDDVIRTVQGADQSNPAQLVQLFVDLITRHQNSFYKFVHEAHCHDEGLFASLMTWIESILSFLRDGVKEVIDVDSLVTEEVLIEVDEYIAHLKAQKSARRRITSTMPNSLSAPDFGIRSDDLDEFFEEDEEEEEEDVLLAEIQRRRQRAGKVSEPMMVETKKLVAPFKALMVRHLARLEEV